MATASKPPAPAISHEQKTAVSDAFARTREFWAQLAWGLVVSVLSVLGTVLFLGVIGLGTRLLWPEEPGPDAFSGTWRILAITTGAGLVIGFVHHFFLARQIDEFEGMVRGEVDPKPVFPGGVLVSLASLIGGFSLGPEVPTGMVAGGLATWLSKRRKASAEFQRSNVLTGIIAAWGGLFTSPFATLLMSLELAHRQSPRYYGTIVIAAIGGVIGFAVLYSIGGFADVIRILDLPSYDLKVWHLALALLFGVLGAVLALVFGLLLQFLKRLMSPLASRPIIRGTAGGFMLGLLGMALPLTLFLGTTGLSTVTEQATQLGLVLIVVMIFAKILATTGALASGFIGGPIFPLLFVGGAAGTAVNLVFPAVPAALAVSCLMAAVPGALLPVPLALAVIVLLIAGIPMTEATPVFVAALAAYFITHGLGLVGGKPKREHDEQQGPEG